MMAASKPPRRRRYERSCHGQPVALTALKIAILQQVADFEILSLPMLAQLMSLNPKSMRWHCRALYDSGYLNVVAVHRTCLADIGCTDTSLIYGSAPNLYTLSRAGSKALVEA